MNRIKNLEELENFLINESKIDKKFIVDFFGFQKKNLYKDYKPFVIDLDDVSFWLDTVKGNLKNTLIESYNKLIDYKIISYNSLLPNQKQKNQGGQNKEIILLTPDCFKMLCLRSKTKKAEKVRKYYIDLEKMIDEYKDIIITNLDNKIKILENDLRKDNLTSDKYCYIFEEIDELGDKYYRIGQTGNIRTRINNHNSSNIHKKVLSFKIAAENILHFEACLRGVMYDYRYKNNKDYYKISKDKIKKAITECTTITKKFKNKIYSSQLIGGVKTIKFKNDEDYLDYKKINTQIKILLSKLTIDYRWNLFDSYDKGYYNGKIMTKMQLKKIVLPQSESNKILIVPCHRDNLFNEIINLGYEKINYKLLFIKLFNFYNTVELDLEYLINIPNDIYDYIKDSIKNKKKGKKIYRIDLIGNLCRFEGIDIIDHENNIYYLNLGS
jgi:hypothetical protein